MTAPAAPPATQLRQFRGTGGNIQTIALSLVISAIVIAFLYVGRDILVPLALASLLSFVLWPLIKLFRRFAGRTTSVLAAVLLAVVGIAGLGAVMSMQITDLANDLPRYESNLRAKVRAFKGAAAPSGAIGKAADAIEGLQEEFKRDDKSAKGANADATAPSAGSAINSQPNGLPKPPAAIFFLRNRVTGCDAGGCGAESCSGGPAAR